ncbi:MAG: class I SAM-dependent methyltransferase [Gemmatimonadetes bacterium]|jgi:ubiquinone/menaquinone biosynthesis C-methylase UbiE|nr:class I SAM-dependent methyltransferase [Gemmatimonadota bacterium]MBT5055299.1 class I SAM-dependent methyltransferase [Gemmatimonadota bacterium]MBT5142831.1 class I SAM-dependent methyltransferase [Gemmatimonadota bacterium]MBT5589424.1 class I SAM-dependent methyltransferase [Gemmatimonadota bacterium]MBT5960035.1 class I SAM-dependent methyltransferase [Gemmatimonadota bacterium]
MKHDKYTETNRQMWNQTAPVHANSYVDELLRQIGAPDYSTFDDVERQLFSQIGLSGKTVAQLACNNGRELISVKKAGAGRCVGFDISDDFVDQGRRLSDAAGVDVEFVRASVYDISSDFDASFDLITITVGVLGWMPNMDDFFGVISRLMVPGGDLFVYEMHPILDMFDADKGLQIEDSYFRQEPFYTEAEPDYMDPSNTVDAPSYWFHHKVSDILGACIRSGLQLTHFEEYAHDQSMVYRAFQDLEKKPPLSYSLIANKTK